MRAALLGLIAGCIGGFLGLAGAGRALEEEIGLSWLFALRGPLPAPPDVVIVNLDEDSAAKLGQPPKIRDWTRVLHGALVDKLMERGASVIAFDVFFEQARSPEDAVFAAAMARSGGVILFQQARRESLPIGQRQWLVNPTEELARAARGLAPFVLPDVPYLITRVWTFFPGVDAAPMMPVVALQVHVLRLLGVEAFQALLERAGIGRVPAMADSAVTLRRLMDDLRRRFRDDAGLHRRFVRVVDGAGLSPGASRALKALARAYGRDYQYQNYYGPPGTLTTVSYGELWEHDRLGNDGPNLAGKVIFVGKVKLGRQLGQGDRFVTVFSREGAKLSGVEIAATAFANLLAEDTLRFPEGPWRFLTVFVAGACVGFLAALLSGWYAVAVTLVCAFIYLGVTVWLFSRHCIWLPVFVPLTVQFPLALLMGLLSQYLASRRARENIGRAIRYYVPEEIARRHESDPELPGPELVYGTCLTSDVANYTSLTETLLPRELAALNNEYFGMLGERIRRRQGEMVGVVGDGMTCIWSAREPDRELRLRACLAGLDVREAVAEFNRRHARRAYPTRIGLHAGWVSIGHVGGGGHFTYGIFGDIVNTASRIEGLSKYLGTTLLAAEPAVSDLDELLVRPLGRYLLKGKTSVLSVYEIVNRRVDATEAEAALCRQFAEALGAFQALRWSEAAIQFKHILECFPLDGPTRFYLGRSLQYQAASSPPADGPVIRLESK